MVELTITLTNIKMSNQVGLLFFTLSIIKIISMNIYNY